MLPLPEDPLFRRVRFEIVADAEPGLLPRLLIPFARRDLITDHVRARRPQKGAMVVEIGVDEMPSEMLRYVEGNLRQVIGVRSLTVVLMGQLQQAA